ncbi:MAG: D-glycero-beta-D-manno-heptose 1-phosphate adenylyltransferase [Bacteroidales bacterium]|nr:D-glycero-beta-D-manno-heptose 1-phosphate adenylyltransferase [Bacteroidales bacterium]
MNSLDIIKTKIITDWNQLPRIIEQWKKAGNKIVFTNGCFDIIHRGHMELLSKASDLGNKLIIGLNSDSSVRNLKGEGRPLQDELSRSLVMAGFSFVDLVVLFPQETPLELIQLILPDILVKGGDYKASEIVGYDTVTKNHGQVITINFVEGYSTTSIVNKMKG